MHWVVPDANEVSDDLFSGTEYSGFTFVLCPHRVASAVTLADAQFLKARLGQSIAYTVSAMSIT